MMIFGAMALAFLLATPVTGCPNVCICKWKGGKEWVECAGRGLQGLPQGAREETQVLDLSNNQLINLVSDGFYSLKLVNLQRLYLARSQISRVASKAFSGLVGLVELDLSSNLLSTVPSETFSPINNLMRLNLSNNPIHEIPRNSFRFLSQLTFLDLSHCEVTSVEHATFANMHSLEWLKLNDNKITFLPDSALPRGGSLHGVTLHNNPWRCDCRLRYLHSWLIESRATAPQETEPSCRSPQRLVDRQITSLKQIDLACSPIIGLSEVTELYEGDNATLNCDVSAVPKPKATWMYNGEMYEATSENDSFNENLNPTARIRYSYVETEGTGNVSVSLQIFGVQPSDEGVYICIAENSGGVAAANLTLRVFIREKSTIEPPFETQGSGFAAAIAAGALVGTLLVLGCLFFTIFFYAKNLKSRKRSSTPAIPPTTSVVPPSILKNSESNAAKEATNYKLQQQPYQQYLPQYPLQHYDQLSLQQYNTQTLKPYEQHLDTYCDRSKDLNTSVIMENQTYNEIGYPDQIPPPREYFIEPDLINEVPTKMVNFNYPNKIHGVPHRMVRSLDTDYMLHSSRSNYLDSDGYPLNFGLPKIALKSQTYTPMAVGTLPRFRQRHVEGSALLPPTRFSRETEFLARSSGYNVIVTRNELIQLGNSTYGPSGHQSLDREYPNMALATKPIYTPPMPSPPSAYKNEPMALPVVPPVPQPLSPKSSKSVPEAVMANSRTASDESLEHPESPDEGYVGDVMDV